MQQKLAHPSGPGRHRPRRADRTEARPAGIPAQVIVNWYWVRRTAMDPQQGWPTRPVSA